jgi:hypothetical protein
MQGGIAVSQVATSTKYGDKENRKARLWRELDNHLCPFPNPRIPPKWYEHRHDADAERDKNLLRTGLEPVVVPFSCDSKQELLTLQQLDLGPQSELEGNSQTSFPRS